MFANTPNSFRLTWIGASVLAVLAAAQIVGTASAEDWPGWRGPDADAVWSEDGLLTELPADGLTIRWRVPVREGYAGPAVADGRVFVADYERIKQSGRLGGNERLMALDETTGEELWSRTWDVNYSALMGSYATGPRATPMIDEDRVYVVGAVGDLVCLAVDTGKVLWKKQYPTDYDVGVPIWGFSSSPVVYGDLLIAIVGGEPDALVVAFDKKTGEEKWRALEASSEPGYSHPVIETINDVEQLIIWHPQGIAGVAPADGEVLWTYPYESKGGMSVATPQVVGNRVFVTQFYGGSLMLELEEKDGKMEPVVLWKGVGSSEMPEDTTALHSLITTPIFAGDTIYGVDSYGELRALEAETGKRLWTDKTMVREGRWGSAFMVANGDRWIVFNDQGDLIFARLDREAYQELGRTNLIEPTSNAGFGPRRHYEALVNWAHPAYANGHVVVRNDKEILSASLLAED